MLVPWGQSDWVLRHLPSCDWGFLGCLSLEDRSLSAYHSLLTDASKAQFVRIFDEDPADPIFERTGLDQRLADATSAGIAGNRIVDAHLLASLDEIEDILDRARQSSPHLILDICTFPKRWFFAIVRLALVEKNFENLVVVYSSAGAYAQVLAYNPEVIKTLPGFASSITRTSCDIALVSVGYHSHSVLELFDLERPRALRMLFPFPPGPPGITRNWRFVERLERSIRVDASKNGVLDELDQVRVGALDLPQNFVALAKATNDGYKTSLVAPFGPKPVSLAMCLFSLAAEAAGRPEVPVYYSQPMRYAQNYTTGVQMREGTPIVYGYPIQVDSAKLYRL